MQEADYKNITPRELKEKLDRGEELVLLDVREPWEFSLEGCGQGDIGTT